MVENFAIGAAGLRAELERERKHYWWLGAGNHYSSLFVIFVTIGASATASLLTAGGTSDKNVVAVIALVPGIMVTLATQLRLQSKADWHYRKYDRLKALLRRLNFESGDNPSDEEVAAISKELSNLDSEMTAEWQAMMKSSIETQPQKRDTPMT